MLTKKIFITLLTVTLLVVSFSCKKLDLAPTDRFSELNFWLNSQNVNNALSNIYGGMYNSSYVFFNESMSDNAVSKLDAGIGSDAISTGNFTISLPRFRNEWKYYYSDIKSCNIFLESVDQNQTLTPAIKERMKGEVRFIRAWDHFNLMKWWGDVPLLSKDLTPDEAKVIARTPKAEVLSFILSELDAAAAVLPNKDQYAAADNGRITKGAAIALKARALLYDGSRMAEVAAACEQLMNNQTENGAYALTSSYTDLFSDKTVNKNNTEAIFSLQYVPTLRTWGDYIDFAPITAGARTNNLSPSQELVDAYIMLNGKSINDAGSGYDENNIAANRDPRLTATIVYDRYNWVNPDGSTQVIYIKPGATPAGASASNEYSNAGQGTATGYYWRKYWDPNAAPGLAAGTNIHLIRYAEILLDYAEAKQSLGQMTAEVWDKTIKVIRQRAGFTDAAALNFPASGDMMQIIRNERRCEFAMEGLRIDDIRRWKIAETVLNGRLHGAKYGDQSIDNGYLRVKLRQFDPAKHYLWPVPPTERDLDANLTQNPNY